MMQLVKDIMRNTIGANEDGSAKCSSTLSIDLYDVEKDDIDQEVCNVQDTRGIIDINIRGDYVELSYTFKSVLDGNLKLLYDGLEDYGKRFSEYEDGDRLCPFLADIIVPLNMDGRYYIMAVNPIFWSLFPVDGEMRGLKVLFTAEDFRFMEAEQDTNFDEIEKEIDREVEEEIDSRIRFEEQAYKSSGGGDDNDKSD